LQQLSLPEQRYVTTVVAAGAALLAVAVLRIDTSQLSVFAALLAVSLIAGRMTVTLPFGAGVSTLSVSYALDLTSMMLIGPAATTLVAAAGVFSHSTVHSKPPKPLHHTLFNIGALVVAVQVAGLVFTLMQAPASGAITAATRPVVSAAAAYFVVYTLLMA
jgi:hypothetical protein